MTQLSSGDPNPSASASIAVAVEDSRLADDIVGRFGGTERDEMVIYDDLRFLVDHPDLVHAGVTIISFPVIRTLARYHMDMLSEFSRHNRLVLLVRSHEFLDAVPYLEFADGVIFQDATMHRMHDILRLSEAQYSILPSAAVMDIVTDRLRCDAIARLTPLELAILDHVRQAKTNRAIARSLSLTEANVKTKVRAILKTLKFQNRTEAAVFAARQQELIRALIIRRTKEAPDSVIEEIESLSREEPTRH